MLRLQGKPLPEAFQELKPLGGDSQWWAVLRLSTRRGAEDMSQDTLQLLQTGFCFSKILMRNQKLPRKMEEENCGNTFYLWTSWWRLSFSMRVLLLLFFFLHNFVFEFSSKSSQHLFSPELSSLQMYCFYLCWYVFFSCKCSTPNSIISSVYITSSFTQNAFRLHKHWVGC